MSYKEENSASNVEYTPSILSDWDSSADPGKTRDALDQLASRVKTIEGLGSVFGSNFNQSESLSTSTISGTTAYQQKLRLSFIATAGTYIVFASYGWRYSSIFESEFKARLQSDDTITIFEHIQEPADSGAEQSFSGTDFGIITLTAGSHFFDLDYGTSDILRTATIFNARLCCWRIS